MKRAKSSLKEQASLAVATWAHGLQPDCSLQACLRHASALVLRQAMAYCFALMNYLSPLCLHPLWFQIH